MIKRLTEGFYNNIRNEIVRTVEHSLDRKGVYASVWDEDSLDDNEFVLYVEIENGDWKHQHLFADNVVIDTVIDKYPDMDIEKIDEEVTADDGSDTYSAIHMFRITNMLDECYLSEDNYNTEHTYRVWYRPYGLDGDEEDYIDVTASNEGEAIRFARTCGDTTDVELLESKQLNEDETSDIENALQNFIDYNSNKNLDRIQKRIACTTEFDNGRVMHGDWQRIPVIDAELMAKEKSLKNPDKTYYVQYDDLMIGSSDLQWKNGQFKAW